MTEKSWLKVKMSHVVDELLRRQVPWARTVLTYHTKKIKHAYGWFSLTKFGSVSIRVWLKQDISKLGQNKKKNILANREIYM